MPNNHRDLIAQWAFDTRPILGRFHLWLEDVEEHRDPGCPSDDVSFVGDRLEKGFIMTAAVTALGTHLFGRYAEGSGKELAVINRVKKDADAISAYAMSESLWYLTRNLPENHALMVCLGEGLMPKVGETPEMGSNPLLGFGRVYARPQIARFLDQRVNRLINDPAYDWQMFRQQIQTAGITLWGAAIDTLENTSRFAKGAETGPMAVLHLFDHPLEIARPYEGYMGVLTLPRAVAKQAERQSILINYFTPRRQVLQVIRDTYPDIQPEQVHVWTLGGAARQKRLGALWEEWRAEGVHLIEEGWPLPSGMEAFTESGTYAPTFMVGERCDDEGTHHVFLVDGYAASAEAIQAASLDPALNTYTVLSVFSAKYEVEPEREHRLMQMDPSAGDFDRRLAELLGGCVTAEKATAYRAILLNAREAGMPLQERWLTIDNFFPSRHWSMLGVMGYMLPDPYTGTQGVEDLGEGRYRVHTRGVTRQGIMEVALTFRLMKTFDVSRLVFSPLLQRFIQGTDYTTRAVKISDSGRIRNELQTLISEALEHKGADGIRVHFNRIEEATLPREHQEIVRNVLEWYKKNHPIWFRWLEIA